LPDQLLSPPPFLLHGPISCSPHQLFSLPKSVACTERKKVDYSKVRVNLSTSTSFFQPD
jgi:hypothetical protein